MEVGRSLVERPTFFARRPGFPPEWLAQNELPPPLHCEEFPMWTKPAFTDLRIGFEVTLYFANR